jgi:hypothetical protein
MRLLGAANHAGSTAVGPPLNHATPPPARPDRTGSAPSTAIAVIEVFAVLTLLPGP